MRSVNVGGSISSIYFVLYGLLVGEIYLTSSPLDLQTTSNSLGWVDGGGGVPVGSGDRGADPNHHRDGWAAT